MFHEPHPLSSKPTEKHILDSITQLTNHLDLQGFIPKLVVAADYLTTFYQLQHLRDKYEVQEFIKISKIDLIMQGNPYSTNADHYQKLKKKLLIIRP